MKKLVCVFLSLSMLFLFSCSKANTTGEKKESESSSQNINQHNDVVLPTVNVNSNNLANRFTSFDVNNFTIINSLNDSYYGFKSSASNYGLNDEFVLIDSQSKEIKLKYPENLTDWFVGSGSSVVLQNRYLYEWHSYNSEVAENTSHDVKLTRIDGKSGNVELVDEIESGTPLIYMCKISDSEFLSYSITKAPSDRTEYAVISAAWIYTEKGEKREIINEKYENNANWTDSEGILIECFAVRDGKILGL